MIERPVMPPKVQETYRWKVRDTQLYGIEKGQTDLEFSSHAMTYRKAGT